MAYKGYLIVFNPFTAKWLIRKTGFHIGYARDEADAKRIIDGLVD